MKYKALALGAACLAVSACAGIGMPKHPLEGTEWRLVTVQTSGTTTTLTPELSSRHTLSFESGSRLQARLDCNRGNASWSASEPRSGYGSITIGQVASTRALCPRPTFGEELAAQLPRARNFTLSEDRTELVLRTDTSDYVFAR